MDSQAIDTVVGEERSSPKVNGRTLPIEQHYFRFERNRNMLSDIEQKSVEKDRHRLRERQRRENMTEEQRSMERERRRLRDEQRRKRMTDEQRAQEKERRRIRERQRRSNMNDEQRSVEMERRRIREREHRQNMDDEQRAKDRERRRERDKQRRESMTEEQRAVEKERRRLYEEQKRGHVLNDKIAARRRRRAEARQRLMMSETGQISGVEQDNQFASYSSDATDGNQNYPLTQDQLQAELANASDWSSAATLDLNEGAMVVYNGDLLVGRQNALYSTDTNDVNQLPAFTQDHCNVNAVSTSEHQSTTTAGLNEGMEAVQDLNHEVGNHNASDSCGATGGDQVLAFNQENMKWEMMNTCEHSSATILDLHAVSTSLSVARHGTIGIHIGDEGIAAEDNDEIGYDCKNSPSIEGTEANVVNV